MPIMNSNGDDGATVEVVILIILTLTGLWLEMEGWSPNMLKLLLLRYGECGGVATKFIGFAQPQHIGIGECRKRWASALDARGSHNTTLLVVGGASQHISSCAMRYACAYLCLCGWYSSMMSRWKFMSFKYLANSAWCTCLDRCMLMHALPPPHDAEGFLGIFVSQGEKKRKEGFSFYSSLFSPSFWFSVRNRKVEKIKNSKTTMSM